MIKEFDLDAPQQQKAVRINFRNNTRCITSLFERQYSSSEDTGKAWKVLVEVVSKESSPEYCNLLGVLTIQVEGNIDAFMSADAESKKKLTLKYLMKGVEKIVDQMKWDIVPFHNAKEAVIANKFENKWVWKDQIINKKSITAELLVEHEVSEVILSARFYDMNGNVLKTQHLVSEVPNEFIFDSYFGKFRWRNDNTVELISRDREKRFYATL